MVRLALLSLVVSFFGCPRRLPHPQTEVWDGTYVASPNATSPGPTLELETSGPPNEPWTEFAATFNLTGLPSPGTGDCTVAQPKPALMDELVCAPRSEDAERCPRRLRLVRAGDGFEVRPTGAGWAGACAPMSGEDVPPVLQLRRAAAVDVMIDRYLWDARQSDLGSSGGRVFSAVLGSNPASVVRAMAGVVLSKLPDDAQRQRLTASQLSELVASVHLALLRKCGGLPFPEVSDAPIPTRCTLADAESVASAVVAEALRRRDQRPE